MKRLGNKRRFLPNLAAGVLMSASLLCQNIFLPVPAFAAAPLAVLRSTRDSAAYQDQHLGTFDDDYAQFKRALEAANVRFDELSDAEVSQGPSKLSGYKMIVLPLLVDLPPEVVSALSEFQRGGGKLLITDSGGTPQDGAKQIEQLAGVTVLKQTTVSEKHKLEWPRQPLPVIEEFAVGSANAEVQTAPDSSTLASWESMDGSKTGPAIVKNGNSIFLTWPPGLQGEISSNANLMSLAMEDLVPGITQTSAVQISFADYQNIQQELEYLTKRTEEAIKTAKQADFAVPLKTVQQNYDAALAHVKQFQDAYHERHYYEADEYLQQARQEFSLAFAQSMPVRPVEARSVWLDRGTIVSTKDPKGMAAVFDRLKSSGINVVYFETNNAGFTMFPSSVATQNPQTLGWDPLGTAVREAHKRGMEIHAWCWIFNVGNNRHNPIVGKEDDYPGPVLSTHKMEWALAYKDGSMLPPRQHEYWIDPANPEGRAYIKSLLSEVATKYPVDGVQFDYIRYPFNGKGSEMGYDWIGRQRFEQETAMSLDRLDDATREVWMAWKIQQVSSFVKEASTMLRQIRPGIRISAAVYALPRRWRLSAIEQEWEAWVANGWVDTLNPMTYVESAKELATMAGYVRESTADRALVYPGLSIRQLDTAGLVEQMDSARATGTLGTTMFAAAHLDDKKVNVLKLGPYRRQPILTPQSEPIKASRMLVDDFAAMVNRYLQDPKKKILSDQASTNDVVIQIVELQKKMHALPAHPSADEIESVNKDVASLHSTIREWLRLEAFIQRGFRAQYIVNYLGQVEAILSYASHKVRSEKNSIAGITQ
ncbi:MAG TPA: family 10 glycosylhydrolase [Oculatellaceae cyanobacterium]